MSNRQKITLRICRRTIYLMFTNSARSSKVLSERELIDRCYRNS
ncbi:hypothetical protein [Pleurocapsa sp. CCALA 161]|nr:hypothetical protein [Pleurocapsa sp. CCALA 161]